MPLDKKAQLFFQKSDCRIFSLKESIFKAYFNLHNRAISFLDIKINSLLKNNAQAHLSTSSDQPTLLLKYKNIHLDSMEYVLTTCIIL